RLLVHARPRLADLAPGAVDESIIGDTVGIGVDAHGLPHAVLGGAGIQAETANVGANGYE
ncbi:MAG: hypothetical protein GX868_00790, partial [Actinobacteria bacterium]|nr:hypothetical protein [Actinomycetota bacterium]